MAIRALENTVANNVKRQNINSLKNTTKQTGGAVFSSFRSSSPREVKFRKSLLRIEKNRLTTTKENLSSKVVSFRQPKLLGKQLNNAYNLARKRALSDRNAGVKIREGLTRLDENRRLRGFLGTLNQIAAKRQVGTSSGPQTFGEREASSETPQPSLLDTIGQSGENYLLESATNQAADYTLGEFGIDTANLSVTGSVEGLLDAIAGSSGGGAAAGAASTVSAAGATASSVLGAVGAAYSAYQLIDNWGRNTPAGGAIQGASMGAYVGTMVMPGIGTAVGAVIGGALGAVAELIHGGKHKDQLVRDAMRDGLEKLGMIDQQHNLELANGELYNIGFDGGHRYDNLDGTRRAPYEIDFSNPLAAQTIGWTQPIAAVLTGGDEKLRTDLTGYIVNASLSNATDISSVQQNVLAIFQKINTSPDAVLSGLTELAQAGKLSEAEFVAYTNGFNTLFDDTSAKFPE